MCQRKHGVLQQFMRNYVHQVSTTGLGEIPASGLSGVGRITTIQWLQRSVLGKITWSGQQQRAVRLPAIQWLQR